MELKREERRYEKEVKAFCKENNMTRAEYDHSRLVPGEQIHLTPEFHSPHNTHLEKMDLFNRYSEDLNRDFEESKVPNSTISYEKCVKEMDKIYEHEVTAYCRENDITRAEYNVRAKENPERFSPEQLNRNQPLQVRNNIIEREARDVKTERDVIIKENERKYERMKEQPEARSEDKKQDKTHEIYHNLYERGIEKYCEEHNIENRNEYNNHIANLEREGKALPEHEALNTNRPPEERIQIIEAAREQQKAHEQIEHTHEREMPERASCPDR